MSLLLTVGASSQLTSERLRSEHGTISPVVFCHSSTFRRSALVDGENIPRMYCLAQFEQNCSADEIKELTEIIAEGALIGATIKKSGLTFDRKVFSAIAVSTPKEISNRFHISWNHCRAQYSEFYFESNGDSMLYVRVCEISPLGSHLLSRVPLLPSDKKSQMCQLLESGGVQLEPGEKI